MKRIIWRHKLWILGLTLAASLCGAFFVWIVWSDGPPLRWTLRGRHFQRVVVHWGKQKIDSRDPQLIARFDNAIRPAFASVNYPTNELADDPENWNVILLTNETNLSKCNLRFMMVAVSMRRL